MSELQRERQILEREIKKYNEDIRRTIGSGNQNIDGGGDDNNSLSGNNVSPTPAKLADLQDRIRTAEQRATTVQEEIIALDREAINEQELTAAISLFDPIWESLSPKEQARIIHLLVEKIGYDGEKESVALTFRPTGIKALAMEVNFGEH
jgi:site-specific DNA recombinase